MLARISHQLSTATTYLTESPGILVFRTLNVLSSTLRVLKPVVAWIFAKLRGLVTNSGEKCGRVFFFFSLSLNLAFATQSYVPPPPPKLPPTLSKEMIDKGKDLFERNVWVEGRLEIYNYLGTKSCSSCHDQITALQASSLAQNFGTLKNKINEEITQKGQGTALSLDDPALEALVQYLADRYQLKDYKLKK